MVRMMLRYFLCFWLILGAVNAFPENAGDLVQMEEFTKTEVVQMTEEARFNFTCEMICYLILEIEDRASQGYDYYQGDFSSTCVLNDDILDNVMDYFMERDFQTSAERFSYTNSDWWGYDHCSDSFIPPNTTQNFYNISIGWY